MRVSFEKKALKKLELKTQPWFKLKVNEIFYSIQGEGITAGTPSVFLRTANCNLRCAWCDSKYTWDWKNYSPETEIKNMTASEVYREIRKYHCRHLVVTGGEPMLQKDELKQLLRILKREGFFIEIETNGTIPPERELDALVDQWNISPKLSHSKVPEKYRNTPEALKSFLTLPNSWFKFVVSDRKDEAEILHFIEKYKIANGRVLLMPQAKTRRALNFKSKFVIELCEKHGFKFSPRLQIQLWGSLRGF